MNKYDIENPLEFAEKERDFIRQRDFEKRLGNPPSSGNYQTASKNQSTLRFIEIERVLQTNPFDGYRHVRRI